MFLFCFPPHFYCFSIGQPGPISVRSVQLFLTIQTVLDNCLTVICNMLGESQLSQINEEEKKYENKMFLFNDKKMCRFCT